MTIEEMHVMFRELAQQMGMQTVRAILPENIDICINIAVDNKVKSLIISNIGVLPYNDKVARQNAAISSINGLRTLYRKSSIVASKITGKGTEVSPFVGNISSDEVMLYLGFKVSYDDKTLYDCRIIEHENLSRTIKDYSNRATKTAPVCIVYGDSTNRWLEIINGINEPIKPTMIQYLYLANPKTVKYDEANTANNVDCDLPSYLHTKIVQEAVDVYITSIGANKNNN